MLKIRKVFGESMRVLNCSRSIEGKIIIKRFINGLWVLYSSIAAICISALAVINSTWIYKLVVQKYNLKSIIGISEEALMDEYKGLINYLQNPFIDKLKFNNFSMSTYGEIHFYEVKRIFIALIIIVAIFMITLLLSVILKGEKYSITNTTSLKNFNNSANLLIIFFIGIVVLYFIDFSWAFTIFHKIFFRNDYWIFDPRVDPIIIALPEELFMICGGAILSLLFIMIITVKLKYYSNRSSVKVNSIGLEKSINRTV